MALHGKAVIKKKPMGLKIKGKPTKPPKKKRAKNLKEHTRSLKSVIKL